MTVAVDEQPDTLPSAMAPKNPCTDLNACNWAMLAHLLAVPGLWFVGGPLIGPLLVWIFRREVHEFVERSAVKAFNFQATVSILLLIANVLLLIGPIIYLILVLADAGLTLCAAWRARGGKVFIYPIAIPFLR